MKMTSDGIIILSRRNLLALLHKLDKPGSSRTLIAPHRAFVITVEEDAQHYANREAGPMTEDTEAFIKEHSRD